MFIVQADRQRLYNLFLFAARWIVIWNIEYFLNQNWFMFLKEINGLILGSSPLMPWWTWASDREKQGQFLDFAIWQRDVTMKA